MRINMRVLGFILSVTLCVVSVLGQTLQGIQVGDLDKKANPCVDFFEYSNGTWRADNPIPASMDRWSRRWAAGEANKDQLRTILDDVSAQDRPAQGKHQSTGRATSTAPAWTCHNQQARQPAGEADAG